MVAAGFFLSVPAGEVWNNCFSHEDNSNMKTGKEPAFCMKKKKQSAYL